MMRKEGRFMGIKGLGCILIIIATSAIGYGASMDMQRQLLDLQYIRQIVLMLKGEIHYTKAPLGEVYSRVGRRLKEPYNIWLTELSRKLENRSQSSFRTLWEESINETLSKTKLKKDDLRLLIQLGEQMGYLDAALQDATLALYLEQLSAEISKRREELSGKQKLSSCLGVVSGIFLAVVLM